MIESILVIVALGLTTAVTGWVPYYFYLKDKENREQEGGG